MTKKYTVTLYLEVNDEAALLAAARTKAAGEGIEGAIEDIETALRWLFDPGADALDWGIQIEDSNAEFNYL